MATNCGCKDSTIEEGVFSELIPNENGFGKYFASEIGGEDQQGDHLESTIIKSYKMTNANRIEVVVISWGATIISIKSPDKYGKLEDIVLGFDNIEKYMDPNLNDYIGCVLGRCANRIKDGRFSIEENDYQLSLNDGDHHLHGGTKGLGRQIWDSSIDGCTVIMTYLSPDGEEGYPGNVLTTIRFKLTSKNKLEINIRATTSKATILNFSHGSIFNLAGHDAGEEELKQHYVTLNCDRWTFSDINNLIPSGGIRGVGGTVMDLRIPKVLGEVLEKIPPGDGFNHNFCVIRSWQPGLTFVARIFHPESGRVLEVYSDKPGVQFYTCGNFPTSKDDDDESTVYETIDAKKFDELESYASYEDEGQHEYHEHDNPMNEHMFQSDSETNMSIKPKLQYIPGKNDARYTKFCGFGIHPQGYPNSANIKHFPCTVIRPGQIYSHDITYKFGVQLRNYM